MAAIGGIFNIEGERVDTELLVKMSKAMSLRGGGGRSAVIFDGCGLIWFSGRKDCTLSELGSVSLLCDGEVFAEKGGAPSSYFGENDADFGVGVFGKYGLRTPEYLWGEYAIAAYDRSKKELVLLRDRSGGLPLYCAESETGVGFATEIKGILAYMGEARVSREALISHIRSGYGGYSGADIYRGITEVAAGAGVVISRLGVTRFDFGRGESAEDTSRAETRKFIGGEFVCPDEEGMARLLKEILYAFDYPQFDCLMPSFLRDCERAREEENGVLDGSLYFDIGYSRERRDRLSAMAGYRPVCAPTSVSMLRDGELKKMEKILLALLSSADKNKLEYIFGRDIEREIMKEGNMARRIRALGMALQCEAWYDGYRIELD